jgi:hypothetical protein
MLAFVKHTSLSLQIVNDAHKSTSKYHTTVKMFYMVKHTSLSRKVVNNASKSFVAYVPGGLHPHLSASVQGMTFHEHFTTGVP